MCAVWIEFRNDLTLSRELCRTNLNRIGIVFEEKVYRFYTSRAGREKERGERAEIAGGKS